MWFLSEVTLLNMTALYKKETTTRSWSVLNKSYIDLKDIPSRFDKLL